MACKNTFGEYIKIKNLRPNGKIDYLVMFDLGIGPFTTWGVAYKWRTGAILLPKGFNQKRITTCKGNYMKTLRPLIIAALEKWRGLPMDEEYRFEKKK